MVKGKAIIKIKCHFCCTILRENGSLCQQVLGVESWRRPSAAANGPPPAGDESSNRLSFDHSLEVKGSPLRAIPVPEATKFRLKQNEGEKVSSERESKTSELVKSQDQVEGNCQENGSPKSLQPVDDPMSKKEVEKTPITDGLMCKTSEEMETDDARGDDQSEESEVIPMNMEQKLVEITGKDLTQERI